MADIYHCCKYFMVHESTTLFVIYVYIYVYMCIYVYIYIHIYIVMYITVDQAGWPSELSICLPFWEIIRFKLE